jgi:hypothetical protein
MRGGFVDCGKCAGESVWHRFEDALRLEHSEKIDDGTPASVI